MSLFECKPIESVAQEVITYLWTFLLDSGLIELVFSPIDKGNLCFFPTYIMV